MHHIILAMTALLNSIIYAHFALMQKFDLCVNKKDGTGSEAGSLPWEVLRQAGKFNTLWQNTF